MDEPQHETSIEDYGAIGDCRTLALVSRFGSVDWCCMPDFSSGSVFAALLDRERGGHLSLAPRHIERAAQHYLPNTNVLVTRIQGSDGVVELTDFMTMPEAQSADRGAQAIVRVAECVAGSVELEVRFEPRPDYAQLPPRLRPRGERQWVGRPPPGGFALHTSFPLQGDETALRGRVAMRQGEVHAAMFCVPAATPVDAGGADEFVALARQKLALTADWWHSWCDSCTYSGDYTEAVRRSALALMLLTHRPTGALVAAGTTSLPESQSGARNWDYRFCWLRDSSLVFDAFAELGYSSEGESFLGWLLHATHRTRPRLQVVYDVHGHHELDEHELPQLRGYHGIGPVRVGNAASHQRQNDVYGEVITAAYDYVRQGGKVTDAEKGLIAMFADMACKVWRKPDHGIWEIRTAPRHNTHSKLMCWAALDRTLRIHALHPLPVDAAHLARERDAIRADIDAKAWNPHIGSYVGAYGTDIADASLLVIPRLGYIEPRDPRMLGTVRHVQRELVANGLLYRYPPGTRYDGVEGGEQLFAISNFWCVDCLARQGAIDEARSLYERLLSLRTPTGLYAEEFDVRTGRPVGNFPQAFSHVGSITAALSLRAAAQRS